MVGVLFRIVRDMMPTGTSEASGSPMDMESVLQRKLGTLFPGASQRQAADQVLARYGTESHERERVRVLLAVLKLAGSDLGRLRSCVDTAKRDYRDVLYWAEYSARSKYGFSSLSAGKERRLAEQDRAQYEEWLRE